MKLFDYHVSVFKKYAEFTGRTGREEFWYFVLGYFLIMVALDILGLENSIGSLYFLAAFVPSLAVSVRRLHDIKKSGWMMLINLIPIIGWIWFIVLMAQEGDKTENIYGPVPKA
jgi:uncharacterized membrane protein YhaH (DUF805 family)